MGWRDYAKQVQQSGDIRDDRDNSPRSEPNDPNVPNVPKTFPLDPKELRQCAGRIAELDSGCPLHDLSPERWRQLLDDAEWLAETFGTQAARDGWTAPDFFGRWPSLDGMGGIADRLNSSRSLVLTADRAAWRIGGVTFTYNRGSYDLPLLWDDGGNYLIDLPHCEGKKSIDERPNSHPQQKQNDQ